MYRLRYRALEAGTAPRNAAACLAVLLASYLFSAFVNATTVTRPALTGPRGRTVILSTRPPAAEGLVPGDIPEPTFAPEPRVEAETTQRL
jgi:hypothetical protein